MILKKCLRLLPLLLTAGASWAQPRATADSGAFLLHKFQQPLGKETWSLSATETARTYSVNFKFVDRGSAVPLKTTIELTPDQEPLRLITHGNTSRFSTINDSVSIQNNTATIRVDDSVYTLPVKENTFPVAGYSPATTQMLLLRYWNKHHQPRIIHALPGGDITISEQGSDAFTFNGLPLVLKRYLISGLVWGNELLWADEKGQLYCLITNDAEGDKLEAMLEPYESLLPAIIDKAAVYGMQIFDNLTKQQSVRHNIIAIRNANLIDVENGRATPGMTILVEDGKIKNIGTAGTPIPTGAFTIDAKGRTVMPGLWDMHAHFEQAEWGPAYLAAGVTTVRDCGNEFGYINAIQQAIDGGKGIGPHILKAGIIDGKGSMSLGIIQASTAEEAVRAVQQYKDNGFVQIKIYSSVSPAMVSVICKEAHRLGLTVSGHIPEGMNLMQGVDSGMDMINHEQYVNSLLKKGNDRTIDYDDTANRKVMDYILSHHVVIDPTLSVFEWIFRSLSDPITNVEPAFYNIPLPLQALFINTGMPAKKAETYRQVMKNMEQQVAIMFHKGVPIVAGTDMGIPGYSLYRELELYVEGGLTPQEALQTATIIPARVLKRDAFSGSLAVGKDADLIIVDGDPLHDIHDIRKVQTVIKGDKIYDPGQLHRMVGFK